MHTPLFEHAFSIFGQLYWKTSFTIFSLVFSDSTDHYDVRITVTVAMDAFEYDFVNNKVIIVVLDIVFTITDV